VDFDAFEGIARSVLYHVECGLRRHIIVDDECDGNAFHCGRNAVYAHCSKEHEFDSCVECANLAALANVTKRHVNLIVNALKREYRFFHQAEYAPSRGDYVFELDSMLKAIPYERGTLRPHRLEMRMTMMIVMTTLSVRLPRSTAYLP
jgi:hypothetical protein